MQPIRPHPASAPAAPRDMDPFDGVLIVNKPAGPTSHDVVDAIRRRFGFRKVGHGGTLDPQATGILVILIGRATRLSERFLGSDKTYEGTIRLGIETDSQDADGTVLREADFTGITEARLQDAMNALKGDIYQTPPMVSAVKVDGVPLYKRARRGEVVERKPRLVHVYEFRLLSFELPRARFVVRCTKGTYVRTLCAEVGTALGCGAHLEALCRSATGEFTLDQALSLTEILAQTRDSLRPRLLPVRQFIAGPQAD